MAETSNELPLALRCLAEELCIPDTAPWNRLREAADEIERLRAALERIAKDPDFGPSALGPAHGSGIYTGWIIARDIAREALSGASPEKNDG